MSDYKDVIFNVRFFFQTINFTFNVKKTSLILITTKIEVIVLHRIFLPNRCKIILGLSLGFVTVLIFLNHGSKLSYADDFTSHIYNLNDTYQGMSYPDLMTKYWDWWINVDSTPPDKPLPLCQMKDIGDVVLLADPLQTGAHGEADKKEPVEFRCTLDAPKALFLPLVMSEYDATVPECGPPCTDAIMKTKAHQDNGDPTTVAASIKLVIDNKTIPPKDLVKLRTAAEPWNISIVNKNNQYEIPLENESITTRAYTEGYYVFLKPLTPGSHVIYYEGASPKVTGSAQGKIQYNLTIKPPVT